MHQTGHSNRINTACVLFCISLYITIFFFVYVHWVLGYNKYQLWNLWYYAEFLFYVYVWACTIFEHSPVFMCVCDILSHISMVVARRQFKNIWPLPLKVKVALWLGAVPWRCILCLVEHHTVGMCRKWGCGSLYSLPQHWIGVGGQLCTLALPSREPPVPIGWTVEFVLEPVWAWWHREVVLVHGGSCSCTVQGLVTVLAGLSWLQGLLCCGGFINHYHSRIPWMVKVTTHLHLVPRLRMCGAIPTLPNTSSWYGV